MPRKRAPQAPLGIHATAGKGGFMKKNLFWVAVVLLYVVVLAGCSASWTLGK